MHQLETLLESTVDKTFDKFEIYTLRNILTVPDELAGWMRLGHYEVSFKYDFVSCMRFCAAPVSFYSRHILLLLQLNHIRPQTQENWASRPLCHT